MAEGLPSVEEFDRASRDVSNLVDALAQCLFWVTAEAAELVGQDVLGLMVWLGKSRSLWNKSAIVIRRTSQLLADIADDPLQRTFDTRGRPHVPSAHEAALVLFERLHGDLVQLLDPKLACSDEQFSRFDLELIEERWDEHKPLIRHIVIARTGGEEVVDFESLQALVAEERAQVSGLLISARHAETELDIERLLPVQTKVMSVLIHARKRMTTEEVIAAIEQQPGSASQGPIKQALSELGARLLIDNRQDERPKGYAITHKGRAFFSQYSSTDRQRQ
jgi:hypothetical protein